jgi:mono/diheme cytochrome c family protein
MRCRRVFFTMGVSLWVLALTVVFAYAQAPADGSLKNPFAGNAEAITLGKAIFEATCAGYCHSTEASRRPGRCPNLFDCEWKYGNSDGAIFHSVAQGVPKTEMVGFKGKLPDEILWKVVAYLRAASRCQETKPPAAAAH